MTRLPRCPALVCSICVDTPQHHPIFVERLGKLDGHRIEKEGVADETILAYHLREMEYMAQVSTHMGPSRWSSRR